MSKAVNMQNAREESNLEDDPTVHGGASSIITVSVKWM